MNLDIGTRLKEKRIEMKLTQEQLSEKLGVSRQTISSWENGRSYPDIISVVMLSDIYDISLDLLLKGDEKMMKYLQESTDIVSSNRKLIIGFILNIILALTLIASMAVFQNTVINVAILIIAVVNITILFINFVKRI